MSDSDPSMLPPGLRTQAYALIDLLLTLVELAREHTELDTDAMLIRMVIAEATMHPLVVSQRTRSEIMDWPELPESVRGSISRVLIAERANLPRETVRRKVNALIKEGMVEEAGHGKVRGNHLLAGPLAQDRVAAGVAAVKKCLAMIEASNQPSASQQTASRRVTG